MNPLWAGLTPPYRTIVADPPWRYMATVRWQDGKFFYEYVDGRPEPLVPTVRPHGWISESSEKRVVSLVKRKGYTFDGSPQFWTGGIGMTACLVPAAGGVRNEDWKCIYGDTLAEFIADIRALPDVYSGSGG